MAWLSFMLLTIFWGCSFLAIRVALDFFPPFAAAGLRLGLAATILLIYGLATGAKLPPVRQRWQWCGIGLVNFGIAWAALFWGEQFVMPAVASIINSTVPLMVTVFSWQLLRHERASPTELFGVFLGFVGILFVFAPSIQGFSLDRLSFYGMLAVLLMSVAYGLGGVLIRRMGATADACWSFVLQTSPAALMLFGLSFLFEPRDWTTRAFADPSAWLGILYLAVFSSAIAWLLYFKLLHRWGVLRASSITYAMPIVSIAVDWMYFRKLPTFYQLVGAGLILQAIYLMRLAKAKPAPLTERAREAAVG